MRSNNKGVAWALTLAMLACNAADARPKRAGAAISSQTASDTPVYLGDPYAIGGVTYTPSDPAYYDEVGYAGLSAGGSKGDATANGEAFAPAAITAAHKSLPLPSYVEVTAIDTGKTILVRVNDRGPMRNDQLIALSPGAAEQLGVSGGDIPVRVRRVNPPEQDRAMLRSQGRAAERLETPASLLKVLKNKLPASHPAMASPATPKPIAGTARPAPASRPGADFDKPLSAARPASKPVSSPPVPKPVPAKPVAPAPAPAAVPPRQGGYTVQVGAFSTRARAEAVAKSVGAHVASAGNLWRVRLGPYPTQQAAQAGVRAAAAKGFENARVMANDAQ
ncbi:septal ring lytic transglycosylase RlpA family protein [Sphingobium sp.]|uniref:septal ring lytic transglycosylase RlpA family protein n=1 Tax=Sphingobium sp. TaxID=1912891 RepID=UPI002CF81534|nr:RlpA-like double-psi beta-barrel domain-containing protein [Sphingobium sp.]HUD90617.1 RlpA-like double-psi beta-barrel domain-containing protein [Sphingobium sp.]